MTEEVRWEESGKTHIVSSMTHNEHGVKKYSFELYYSINSEGRVISIDCYSENTYKRTITITDSIAKRPIIAASSTTLFFLNDKNFESFDIQTDIPTLTKVINDPQVDEYSPMDVIENEMNGQKQVFVVACRNNKITTFYPNFTVAIETGYPCGKYLSVGYNYLTVKEVALLELYSIGYNGNINHVKTILLDQRTQTYSNDPMVMSDNDIIFTVLSDLNEIQVNSPYYFDTGMKISNITFNTKDETLINTLYSNMISTYGSFLLVGAFGYSSQSYEREGQIHLYFDNILSLTTSYTSTQRFTHVLSTEGKFPFNYAGYSVSMDSKYLFVGGASSLNINGVLDGNVVDISKYTSKYCNDYYCYCIPGYYLYNMEIQFHMDLILLPDELYRGILH